MYGVFKKRAIESHVADCFTKQQNLKNVWVFKSVIMLGYEENKQQIDYKNYKAAVIFEGRIDNRENLLNLLDIKPATSTRVGVEELIIRIYRKFGRLFSQYILGEFAFALWDKITNELIVTTDTFSTKPIYYVNNNEIFSFSTNLDFLFTVPGSSRKPDLIKIANSGMSPSYLYTPKECRTYFADIKYIPGFTTAKISSSNVEFYEYWFPHDYCHTHLNVSESECIDAFNEIFTQSVNSSIAGAKNIGLKLSGGLDSTAIAAMLIANVNNSDKKISCLSFVLPDEYAYQGFNEEKNCIELLKHPQLEIDYISFPGGIFENLYEAIAHGRLSGGAPYFSNTKCTMSWCEHNNIDRLLSGSHGELGPTFIGYEYCSKFFACGMWSTWLHESYLNAKRLERSWPGVLLRNMVAGVVPRRVFRPKFYLDRMLKQSFLDNYAPKQNSYNTFKPHVINQRQNQVNLIKFAQYSDAQAGGGYKQQNLLVRPYQNRRILEYCLGLPDHMYFKDGYNRYLIRKAMQDKLPDQIRNRMAKFNNNSRHYYNQQYILGLPKAEEILENISKNSLVQEVINLDELRKLIKSKSIGNYCGAQPLFLVPNTLGLGVFLSTF